MELKHETDILIAETRKGLLVQTRHIGIVVEYMSAVRTHQCSKYLEQSRLPGTRGTDNTYHLSFPDGQVDVFQHLEGSKRLVKMLYPNHTSLPLRNVRATLFSP